MASVGNGMRILELGTTRTVTGSLAESQYSPFSANRLPRWIAKTLHCVGPVLSVSDSSAPSPPGSSGPGLTQQIKGSTSGWPFLFGPRLRQKTKICESARPIGSRDPKHARRFHEISAATCRPRPAWGRACRDCHPGPGPRRRQPRHAPSCRAIRSSFPDFHSSRRPSRDCAPRCNR